MARTGTWRLANITKWDETAAHVVNQAVREINARIDVLNSQQRPYIKGSSRMAFGTIPPQSSIEATAQLINATTTGVAHASPAQGITIPAGISWQAYVSQQHQVRVRLTNITASPIPMPTILWNVTVTI